MPPAKDLEPSQVLDTLGELIAGLAAFAAKVPAHASLPLPGGLKPTPEAVESYETVVYRFRERAGHTFKALNSFFLDSLEAFEAGRVIDAVLPLVQAIDRLVALHAEEKIQFSPAEQGRIREYHRRLEGLLPETSKPEIDLPPPTIY
ncbi:MAG: hypothetical protein D6704_06975 [Nitrospirae bacterium]|nr:MAG: hypothetical protein D6704_06975 [Nitrospirota bacterium]